MTRSKKVFTELIQFVPIITLASSFIVKGGVDPATAGPLFLVAGAMAVCVTVWLGIIKVTQNPILLASNVWLLFGAVAFGVPVPPLADIFIQTNALLLFAAVFALGIIYTIVRPRAGFIAMSGADPETIKRLSVIMLALSALALVWAIFFRENIRLGGGLPFIVLNVTRRVLMRRALAKQSAQPTRL